MGRWLYLFGMIGVGLLSIEVMSGSEHAHEVSIWDQILGFDLVFGFLGCAILVYFSKGLVGSALQKPEDFYGEDE